MRQKFVNTTMRHPLYACVVFFAGWRRQGEQGHWVLGLGVEGERSAVGSGSCRVGGVPLLNRVNPSAVTDLCIASSM